MTNPLATRALLYGVLSLFLGLLTLLSVVGFAGAVTGTFALFYGVLACQQANRSPSIRVCSEACWRSAWEA